MTCTHIHGLPPTMQACQSLAEEIIFFWARTLLPFSVKIETILCLAVTNMRALPGTPSQVPASSAVPVTGLLDCRVPFEIFVKCTKASVRTADTVMVGMCMADLAMAECSLCPQHQAGCVADCPLKGYEYLASTASQCISQAPPSRLHAGKLPCCAGSVCQRWPDMVLWHSWQVLRSWLWHQQSLCSDFPQRTGMSSGKHSVALVLSLHLWSGQADKQPAPAVRTGPSLQDLCEAATPGLPVSMWQTSHLVFRPGHPRTYGDSGLSATR